MPTQTVFDSPDLSGMVLREEPNPGVLPGQECNHTTGNVDLNVHEFDGYGEVASNVLNRHEYVAAVAGDTLMGSWPSGIGGQIAPAMMRMRCDVRLPVPVAVVEEGDCPQNVMQSLSFWGGRAHGATHSLEAALYWHLNPWDPSKGVWLLKAKTGLVNTLITVPPDTEWHRVEFVVDFSTQKWIAVAIDEQSYDAAAHDLDLVERPTWGADAGLVTSVAGLNAWPGETCRNGPFSWRTHYRSVTTEILTP